MERAKKLAKLQDLRSRLPHISQSALEAVLSIASKTALPNATRTEIRQSRDEIAKQSTPYGQLHKSIDLLKLDGSQFKLEIQCLFTMFSYLCLRSLSYGQMVKQTCVQTITPSSPQKPWSFILYTDEVSPGNQLQH
eukprot:1409-Amphidinium_carterae.1